MFGWMLRVPASGRVHDSLARLLSKGGLEVLAIMFAQEVPCHRLATVLVDSLEDLVARGVAQTGEEGEELSSEWRVGLVFEDDLVQVARIANLWRYLVFERCCRIVRRLLLCSGCSSIASQWYRPVSM